MRFSMSAAALVLVSQVAFAQTGTSASGATLSLDEAIALAKQNNPAYLTQLNARRSVASQTRTVYGALLPSVSSSFGANVAQAGQSIFQGNVFGSQASEQSFYNLGVSYQINAAALVAPKLQNATRAATEADITGNAETLRATVTEAYLAALKAEAVAALQDTLVLSAQLQLDMASAKVAVGSGTNLDVKRAQVTLGQAQITALTAQNQVAVSKLQLYQQIGADMPAGGVQLTTRFPVAAPTFTLDGVLAIARGQNPALASLRAHEQADALSIREAQGAYTPTLSLSTGWTGNSFEYTNINAVVKQDSLEGASPQQLQIIRTSNNVFPFKFQRSPLTVSASLSFPIFNGFGRENNLQQAIIVKDNARYSTRAQELLINSAVTQDYLQLMLTYKTIALREQNADESREELQLSEEKYRVGQATFLDVITSRTTFEQALNDRISAIYDFHNAFAALEGAVGRPLR